MKSHTIAATKNLELERCIHATGGYAFFRLVNHEMGNVRYPKVVNKLLHGMEVHCEDATREYERQFIVNTLLTYCYV